MEAMIEAIKLAVDDDATDEAKQAGAEACRVILTALEAEPGSALVAPAQGSGPGEANAAGIALATPAAPRPSPLAGLDVTQVLDLVIAKLRSVAGEEGAAATPSEGYKVQIVPVPGRK